MKMATSDSPTCRFYQRGFCKFGLSCNNAHDSKQNHDRAFSLNQQPLQVFSPIIHLSSLSQPMSPLTSSGIIAGGQQVSLVPTMGIPTNYVMNYHQNMQRFGAYSSRTHVFHKSPEERRCVQLFQFEAMHGIPETYLVTGVNEAEELVTRFVLNQSILIVGLDMEWRVHTNTVAIIQICTAEVIIILHLPHTHLPRAVLALLRSPSVVKCGVDLSRNLEKLKMTFTDCEVVAKSVVDLDALYRFATGHVSPGLRHLARDYLGIDLNKSRKVRATDWFKPLTIQQVQVAAIDAFVNYKLAILIQDSMSLNKSTAQKSMSPPPIISSGLAPPLHHPPLHHPHEDSHSAHHNGHPNGHGSLSLEEKTKR